MASLCFVGKSDSLEMENKVSKEAWNICVQVYMNNIINQTEKYIMEMENLVVILLESIIPIIKTSMGLSYGCLLAIFFSKGFAKHIDK